MNCITCGKTHKKMYKSLGLCRPCYRKLPNIYQSEKASNNKWSTDNRQAILESKKKKYQENILVERQKRSTYEKLRVKNDINFKLRKNIRTRIKNAVRRSNKNCTIKLKDNNIVFDINMIRNHLESKFKPGMTWDNYGEWEIDHVTALCKFDLSKIEEVQEVCKVSNLQPLWKEEHRIKTAMDIKP